MPSHNAFWTLGNRGEQVVLLRRLGWTPAVIAAYLGTTKNAIIGYLDRRAKAAGPSIKHSVQVNRFCNTIIRTDPDPRPPTLDERLRWDVVMASGCRWVMGEPGNGRWRWCAAPLRVAGEPYCREHFEVSRRGFSPTHAISGRR